MNFEKISFRTNEKERQLFTRLNQRYKCRSITSLMHKFFQEIDNKQPFAGNKEASLMPDIFDGIDFDSYGTKEQIAEHGIPIASNRSFASKKELDSILRGLENISIEPDEPKEESKPFDAFEGFLKDLEFMERFRDTVHRSSPFIRRVYP